MPTPETTGAPLAQGAPQVIAGQAPLVTGAAPATAPPVSGAPLSQAPTQRAPQVQALADTRTPLEMATLSDDEKAVVRHLVEKGRHLNNYNTKPKYLGWNYLANVVWYMRQQNPERRKLADDEVERLKKDFAPLSAVKVPSIDKYGPRTKEWDAIYYGGVIPWTQEVLKKIRAPAFADIVKKADIYTSTGAKRLASAKDEALDSPSASMRLQMIDESKQHLGTEYAQSHPEDRVGGEYGRRPTLDCTGFIAKVFGNKLGFGLASQVSRQYMQSIQYPSKLRIIMGYRCKQEGNKFITRDGSKYPVIEEKVDYVTLTGEIIAGDLGIKTVKDPPKRHPTDGGITDDFQHKYTHIVMFTGRKGSDGYEYIHASDFGEGVDIKTESLSVFDIIMRPCK